MQQKETEKQTVLQVKERANTQGNEDKRKREQNSYHNWFLVHSGMKKDAQLLLSHSQSKETMENNLNNKSEDYEEELCDYDIWFKKHSGLLEEEIKRAEKNFEIYTSICKKYYPFIIRPVNNLGKNHCNKHLNDEFFLLYL